MTCNILDSEWIMRKTTAGDFTALNQDYNSLNAAIHLCQE